MKPSPATRVHATTSADAPGRLRPLTWLDVARDWVALLRPRVATMVALCAFIGALVAAGPGAAFAELLEAALWITLVAGAASIFNQVVERDTDALMHRTRNRPLPTGRLRARDVLLFGGVLATVAITALALRFNVLAALLALGTLSSYVLLYTPLKRLSSLNTVIGAVPGAMPPLLGAVALTGTPGPWGWSLFATLFVWQFPHFLAIAWLYREDYARAGMKMLPALPGSEGLAGRQAFLYSLVLIPVSLLPATGGQAGPVYVAAALVLGAAYALASALFGLRETRGRARAVLLVSLLYLPLVYSFCLLDPVVALSHGLPIQ